MKLYCPTRESNLEAKWREQRSASDGSFDFEGAAGGPASLPAVAEGSPEEGQELPPRPGGFVPAPLKMSFDDAMVRPSRMPLRVCARGGSPIAPQHPTAPHSVNTPCHQKKIFLVPSLSNARAHLAPPASL